MPRAECAAPVSGDDVQTTLRSTVRFAGVGLHTGQQVKIAVHPAEADSGVSFNRTDVTGADAVVPAHWRAIAPSNLCTRVANSAGVSVSTIEHLMAALAGCGVHNARIDIDGPEVPILDGSAAPFVAKFVACGVTRLDAPVRAFRVCAPVEVRDGAASARLDPAESLEMAFAIAFDDIAIGQQTKWLDLSNGAFARQLSDSRTFCRRNDVETMRANGLARGGSYRNAVVFDGADVLSPGGLRHADEPVRHKMLDAMGDLALAGGPLLGRYSGDRSGHALTARLLGALFTTPGAVERVDCDEACARRLPGFGVCRADVPLSA